MNQNVRTIDIVNQLCSLGMRQGKATIQAGRYIEELLKKAGLDVKTEYIDAILPDIKFATLQADGLQIPCKATSFVSGSFKGGSALVSSLISSRYLIDAPNINFNPFSKNISRSNFYFAPSVAIRKSDIAKIVDASEVSVSVRVLRKKYRLPQFLVGNIKNPTSIVFAHFDSIELGAIDNASGTAVCLSSIIRKPELLKTTLVVKLDQISERYLKATEVMLEQLQKK